MQKVKACGWRIFVVDVVRLKWQLLWDQGMTGSDMDICLISKKILPALLRTYSQMAEPKYVLAIGACAYDGGPYNDSVAVIKEGLEQIKDKIKHNVPSLASQSGLYKQMDF